MFGAPASAFDLQQAMSHCSLGQLPPGKRMCIAQENVPRDDRADRHCSSQSLCSLSEGASEADMDMDEVDSMIIQHAPLVQPRRASPCLEDEYQSYAVHLFSVAHRSPSL
jgi:hypothetical protein